MDPFKRLNKGLICWELWREGLDPSGLLGYRETKKGIKGIEQNAFSLFPFPFLDYTTRNMGSIIYQKQGRFYRYGTFKKPAGVFAALSDAQFFLLSLSVTCCQ